MISDDFTDRDRDNRASVDPTGYDRESAELKSRSCPHCSGSGFATVFHPDYSGSSIVATIDVDGRVRKIVGRTCAYCICLFGRWLLENHKKTAKDVYGRMPDFADIYGRSSYWLETDPTQCDLSEGEITQLPASWREMIARRINHNP